MIKKTSKTTTMKLFINAYRGGYRRCPFCLEYVKFPDSGYCPNCGENS